MEVYIINTDIVDFDVENNLLEGSQIRLNTNIAKINVGSVIFMYSINTSVHGVYAVVETTGYQEKEHGPHFSTAKIMRKENYPMIEDEDFVKLGIKPTFVEKIEDENIKKALFSLMDRSSDELQSRFDDIDKVAKDLDVTRNDIQDWYKYVQNNKEHNISLPLIFKDYKNDKYYIHKKALYKIKEFKKYIESHEMSHYMAINCRFIYQK